MTDDLVKRLREWWNYDNGRLFENAITHIEALTAERDHAWEMVAKADTQVGQSLVDRLQDKAQIDRLREAIVFWLEAEEPDVDAAINMMRAALKGETP